MRGEKMKSLLIWFVVFFALLGITQGTSAWECDYGEVKAWVKFQGDNEWREAPVEDVTLKVHEPFEVKIEVTIKKKCHFDLNLYEPGVTPAYEVINGPSTMGGWADKFNVAPTLNITYEWTLRTTGNWTHGTAPLNFLSQFTETEDYDYDIIEKTILLAYISSEEWKENNENEGGSGGGIPGFEMVTITFGIFLYFLMYKRGK